MCFKCAHFIIYKWFEKTLKMLKRINGSHTVIVFKLTPLEHIHYQRCLRMVFNQLNLLCAKEAKII